MAVFLNTNGPKAESQGISVRPGHQYLKLARDVGRLSVTPVTDLAWLRSTMTMRW
jgi:hypothetical protein